MRCSFPLGTTGTIKEVMILQFPLYSYAIIGEITMYNTCV